MSEQGQDIENPEVETQETAQEQSESAQESADNTVESVVEQDSQVEALQAEVAELKEEVLRAQAETQNVRRRAEVDVEKAHKFSTEKFARELLEVVDNLERAIAASPEDEVVKPFLEGVEMTQKSFVNTLKKFKVEAIEPEGHPFDPDLHQAISMVDAPDAEPNTVLNVVQKGYTIHDRLLRPAMVVVSKAAPAVDEKA
ncbi:nucleotide exchange factor GrpE [Bermanella marisrubri]|uniref:Protein GrpE n=1 Tax=Bermanella marisrubri TaxID=207949 RepID=Q1N390_9GAMM|nr:nucleotide exchange factor GrpE [Bermanella marisrubri]EAT12701.1 co-chaperone GrpE [Oceanobacter sp. RED65] [Bermanella marisrubri]QIZ85178.1 nucleotide exchange factor GrpE [Bermanella marisrubri]